MTKSLHDQLTGVMDPLMQFAREEITRQVADQMRTYRQAMYVRDHWCCPELQEFAAKVWGVSTPKRDTEAFGQVAFQLRGHHVNYCPFCGVHVGSQP